MQKNKAARRLGFAAAFLLVAVVAGCGPKDASQSATLPAAKPPPSAPADPAPAATPAVPANMQGFTKQ